MFSSTGEHFYLDVDGYHDVQQLEEDLCHLGASVEKFLDKQVVTKVITNKREVFVEKFC